MVMTVAAILLVRFGYVKVRPKSRTIETLLETAAAVIAYTGVLGPISYFCARNAMPLFDGSFRAADRMMGYDWQAWADYETSIPALSLILRLAYASLIPQTLLILAVSPLLKGGQRGFTMIRASFIAATLACAGSYFLPAAMPEAVHTDWYPDWAALRGTEPFSTSLPHINGIITFPSFHAALAIIMLYSVRGLGPVTWAFGVVEALLLVATTTYGHHYLADVVAGVVVAGIAIILARLLDRHVPPVQSDFSEQ